VHHEVQKLGNIGLEWAALGFFGDGHSGNPLEHCNRIRHGNPGASMQDRANVRTPGCWSPPAALRGKFWPRIPHRLAGIKRSRRPGPGAAAEAENGWPTNRESSSIVLIDNAKQRQRSGRTKACR